MLTAAIVVGAQKTPQRSKLIRREQRTALRMPHEPRRDEVLYLQQL